MREEEVATKSREIQDCYFTVAVKSSGDISEEPEEDSKARNKLWQSISTHNDENRPSLTSGAATVAELQEVSSKNTINEMADPISGGNDIGL